MVHIFQPFSKYSTLVALHVRSNKATYSHVKHLNGEFETLENAYASWQSIQISVHKASFNLYQHKYIFTICV